MAKQKKQNSKLIDTIIKFYTPIVIVMLFGIIGSLFLYSSSAATVGLSGAVERDQISRISSSRSSRGIAGLKNVDCLNNLAEKWAKKMAAENRLYHNPYLGSSSTNTWSVSYYCGGWTWVGENVGYGATSSSIYTAFMNSAGHKANILDRDYSRVGVGAYYDANGRLWVAQVFAKCSTCTSTKWQTSTVYPN